MKQYVGVVIYEDGSIETFDLKANRMKLAIKEFELILDADLDDIKTFKVVSK